MQLTSFDPSRDRLLGPAEQFRPDGRRSPQGSGFGVWALRFFIGALLIAFGFAIAVVGLMEGFLSQGQLRALFTGEEPASAPASSAQQMATPAAVVQATTSEATPDVPAAQQTRVLRDEAFGDWRFVCVEAEEGAVAGCSATQQLLNAETGAAVFIWRIVQDGQGGLVGIWQVPETVRLAAGLTLEAGTPQPIVMPFDSCGVGSCQVIANLAPDFIETLSGTETLSGSVTLGNGQVLTFPLSPDGLDEVLAALSE